MFEALMAPSRIILACLIGLAVAAPPASAIAPTQIAGRLDYGPMLADGGIIYGTDVKDARGNIDVSLDVFLLKLGQQPAKLASFETGNFDKELTADGSSSHTAVLFAGITDCSSEPDYGTDEPCVDRATALTGDQAAATAPFDVCFPADVSVVRRIFELDGSRLARPVSAQGELRCGSKTSIVIGDLAGVFPAVMIPVDSPHAISAIRLNGDYVAVLHRKNVSRRLRVDVFDSHTGVHRYSVNLKAPPYVHVNVALRSDGTVAVAYQHNSRKLLRRCGRSYDVVRVFSVSGPIGRCVAVLRTHTSPEFAGEQVLATTRVGKRRAAESLVDFKTGAKRILLEMPREMAHNSPAFDLDDGRVAWSQEDCRETRTWIADLAEFGAARSLATCPLQIPRQRLTMNARGEVKFRFGCPNGCTGLLDVIGPQAIGDDAGDVTIMEGGSLSRDPIGSFEHQSLLATDVRDFVKRRKSVELKFRYTPWFASVSRYSWQSTFSLKVIYRRGR